jgi:hypothetical protein
MQKQKKDLPQTVFISYNKADAKTAKEIASFCALAGINVWFAEWEMHPGDSIIGKQDEGIKKCSHMLLLWSKNAKKSKFVEIEWRSFLTKNLTKTGKLIVIRLDRTKLPSILIDRIYITFSRENICKIIETIINTPIECLINLIFKKHDEVLKEFQELEKKSNNLGNKNKKNYWRDDFKNKVKLLSGRFLDYSKISAVFYFRYIRNGDTKHDHLFIETPWDNKFGKQEIIRGKYSKAWLELFCCKCGAIIVERNIGSLEKKLS